MSGLPGTIGIVGLGLMGASLSMGIRRVAPGVRLVAVEPRDEIREQALGGRVVDEALPAPGGALASCDLAVLCTPVASIEVLLGPVAGPLARSLAGAGLRDMTRLAAFPFDVQGEVSRRNTHLPEAAARFERHLKGILAAIAGSPDASRNALEAARAATEELS
jgi:prephenate dehydrogenase